jgi:hypothetical protein
MDWRVPIKGERPYNDYERAYLAIATAVASDVPCRKIARTAVGAGGFSYHIYYVRSECYMNVAALTRNPDLCRGVVSAGSWFQALLLVDSAVADEVRGRNATLH